MRRSWLILAAILVAAAGLRFCAIEAAGVYGPDDARALLDARAKYEELRVIGGVFAGKWRELRGGGAFLLAECLPEAHETLSEHRPVLPNVLSSWLIALALLVGGFTPWAGSAVEAGAGVLCVAATYFFLRRLASRRAALLAAGMLALSCCHVYFSRNSSPQTVAGLFWILAFHAHFRWGRRAWRKPSLARTKPRLLALSGALAGLAVLASFQLAAAAPALFAAHLIVCLRQRRWRSRVWQFVRGGAAMAAGFAAVLLVAELSSYPMFVLFRKQDLLYPHATFLEAFAGQAMYHWTLGWHPTGLAAFPYFLGVCEGWIAFWVLAGLTVWGGAYVASRIKADPRLRRNPRVMLPLVYLGSGFFVPYALYGTRMIVAARLYAVLLPFLFGMTALGIAALWRGDRSRRKWRRWAIAAGLAVMAASAVHHDLEIAQFRSAYPEALDWARAEGASTVASPWPGPLSWHLTCRGMAQPDEGAPGYFVTDWQALPHGRYPGDSPFPKPGAEPVKVFEHQFNRIFLEIEATDHVPAAPIRNLVRVRDLELDRARRVPVYRLADTTYDPAAKHR